MPGMDFILLRDRLNLVAERLAKEDLDRAELLLQLLVDDMCKAGEGVPPTRKTIGKRAASILYSEGASMCRQVGQHLIRSLGHVKRDDLAGAIRNLETAVKVFRDSPWYPGDEGSNYELAGKPKRAFAATGDAE